MRIHFGITEESRKQHQKELKKLDERIKSYGLKEVSFGLYEGDVDEVSFASASMWVLAYPFISDEGLFYYAWFDKENTEKGDMMESRRKAKSYAAPLRKEYYNLLKDSKIIKNND